MINVVEDDDGSLNSGQLLVELPPKSPKRRSVLGMANELNELHGFGKEGDTGQQFVLVVLD